MGSQIQVSETPLHGSSSSTNRLCGNSLAQTQRHTNRSNYITITSTLLSTRQNHARYNRMLPHYRNHRHGTRNRITLTTMASHKQNPANHYTNENHGHKSSNSRMDNTGIKIQRLSAYVKSGKSK